MKKKILFIMICCFFICGITACEKKEENVEIEERQSTMENSSIPEVTSSTEPEGNPYIISMTAKEFFAKIETKEEFYVAIVQDGCGACNAYKPILHQYALREKVIVYEINLTTDTEENVSKLIHEWGITHTPTTLHIQNGKEKKRLTGYQTEEHIKSFMNK